MEENENWKWTPEAGIVCWRILGLLLLYLSWIFTYGSESGVVPLLFLTITTAARSRFDLPGWTVMLDSAVCMVFLPILPFAFLGMFISVFEAMLKGEPWFGLLALLLLLLQSQLWLSENVLLLVAAFAGMTLRGWKLEAKALRREGDRQRRDHYELERFKNELLAANVRTARTAELAERDRISRDLHDHVGHELTAAVLAVQAFEELWKEDDPLSAEMFGQIKERLTKSSHYLRDTVHNMKPLTITGIHRLEEICTEFASVTVDFESYGDSAKVPVYLWSILEPCLKEALTNVSRHAQATKVEVSLDITPAIVRLSVYDNGPKTASANAAIGVGLKNLRQRAQAVNGSVSVSNDSGFRLICVLPINERRSENEYFDR